MIGKIVYSVAANADQIQIVVEIISAIFSLYQPGTILPPSLVSPGRQSSSSKCKLSFTNEKYSDVFAKLMNN